MNKKEKFILISIFLVLATVLNAISCFKSGMVLNTVYYFFYSLIPYIIYSSIIVSIKNRAVVYVTVLFLLVIDFLMKIDISKELLQYKPNVIYSWILMTPLILVSLIFLVFVLFITGVWICKRKGIKDLSQKLNIPERFQFNDDELGKFIFIILSFGFLINFQDIVHVCTSTLGLVLGIQGPENIPAAYLLKKFLMVLFAMMPYFIFVIVSYYLNCRWISYVVGFTAIIFDVYLKAVSLLFSNTGYELGNSFSEVLTSIFNPFTFILFIPIAFALLFFGKKMFDSSDIMLEDEEPAESND